jgi:hypothetical protein
MFDVVSFALSSVNDWTTFDEIMSISFVRGNNVLNCSLVDCSIKDVRDNISELKSFDWIVVEGVNFAIESVVLMTTDDNVNVRAEFSLVVNVGTSACVDNDAIELELWKDDRSVRNGLLLITVSSVDNVLVIRSVLNIRSIGWLVVTTNVLFTVVGKRSTVDATFNGLLEVIDTFDSLSIVSVENDRANELELLSMSIEYVLKFVTRKNDVSDESLSASMIRVDDVSFVFIVEYASSSIDEVIGRVTDELERSSNESIMDTLENDHDDHRFIVEGRIDTGEVLDDNNVWDVEVLVSLSILVEWDRPEGSLSTVNVDVLVDNDIASSVWNNCLVVNIGISLIFIVVDRWSTSVVILVVSLS